MTGYAVVKTLHVVFMVTWFAGLFYLPRVFVYHALASAEDRVGIGKTGLDAAQIADVGEQRMDAPPVPRRQPGKVLVDARP